MSKEITDLFFNDPTYALTSRTKDWLNVSAANSITYSVYCSEDCDMVINWAVDDQFEIIETNTSSLTGGNAKTIYMSIKAHFTRFNVTSIVSTPNDLKTQVFFC